VGRRESIDVGGFMSLRSVIQTEKGSFSVDGALSAPKGTPLVLEIRRNGQ